MRDLTKKISETEKVDVKENTILKLDTELLSILLKDQTTNKNIIWATSNYEKYGYKASSNITIMSITGRNGNIIKPRTEKSKEEQLYRIRDKAEVFTPSWICNKQNNLIDESWFGFTDIFNVENEKSWTSTTHIIDFSKTGRTWQEYVSECRLEISCGEAPYLTSRYDTVTGKAIYIDDRIGLLDRKLRVLDENVNDKEEWFEWSKVAYKSIYGYDWQGDNVLLARENLLYTFFEYYHNRFNENPTNEMLIEIATIISWNIWQMDGLKFVVPNSCKNENITQYSLFGETILVNECEGCKKSNIHKHNGIYCKIKNWETGRAVKFISLLKK